MTKPNFFIVGAPKCGTTAMYEYLKAHPDIFLCPQKEVYYFGKDLNYVNYKRLSEAEYLALFALNAPKQIVGEASVTYLVSATAAQEIKLFNPSANILIMLRNPIDMMYSMHSQALFTQVEDVGNFAAALELESARKQGRNIPANTTILSFILYRELATYSKQVKRYLDNFGRDRVHVIIYDDFQKNTLECYRNTLRFLEVDDSYQPDSFERINVNKVRRNELLIHIGRNPRVIQAVRTLIPYRPLRQYIALKMNRAIVQERPRPPLAEELRSQLKAEFLPEVRNLSALLERDLTYWCK